MRVGFLGPSGTYAEEALRASAPRAVDEVPFATVYETVMGVQAGVVERAVVPIENSLEGSVSATLDALAGEADRVRIVAEVVRPISHCLVARPGVGLDSVTRVVSHPQALAQCRRFLRDRLPAAAAATTTSTAEAVRLAASSAEPVAAIGTRLAADLYGCEVLAGGVEDRSDNLTRFVWLAPEGTPPQGGPADKTSIVFWGFNDESPGALVGVLREFADRAINLTKIESRPRRVRLGHYMFFADLAGAADAQPVADALDALRHRVETLKVLGSYPGAADSGQRTASERARPALRVRLHPRRAADPCGYTDSTVAVAHAAAPDVGPGTPDPAPTPALPDARTQRGGASGRVLVLNASYEAINVCTVRRAAVLVLKERAEILEASDRALHAEAFEMPRPTVIRLIAYVRVPRDAHSRKITRRAIFARDKWTCQYCGSAHSHLTVDHVVPRSKGGGSTWDNVVTCCAPCNRRKGDRLPKHANMHPRSKPAPPSSTIFVHVAVPRVPEVWQQYLAA